MNRLDDGRESTVTHRGRCRPSFSNKVLGGSQLVFEMIPHCEVTLRLMPEKMDMMLSVRYWFLEQWNPIFGLFLLA